MKVPVEEITTYDYPFRRIRYYPKYTNKNSKVLNNCCNSRVKPAKSQCNTKKCWSILKQKSKATKVFFTYVPYRKDKSDCHPQKELDEVLRNL